MLRYDGAMVETPALEAVPLTQGSDGVIRVGGSRVQLETVILAFQEGATPEEIAQNYSTLALDDVYLVIAYYLRHRRDVDVYVARRLEAADALRKDIETRWPPDGIQARLLARRAKP
jgi:uncharacterized protein (DUF433 family)